MVGGVALLVVLLGVGVLQTDAQTFDQLHGFENPPVAPYGKLMEGSDGALYGTTLNGGAHSAGILFRVDRDGSGFISLHTFDTADPANGATPYARLIEGSDGALYGTAFAGGAYGAGIVFRINKDGSSFINLHDFNSDDVTNGAKPYGGVIEGSDGALYGTTRLGGLYAAGSIFRINRDGSDFFKLHDFNPADAANGAYPFSGLTEGTDGALYGTVLEGGIWDLGSVFRLNKDGTGFLKLHGFWSGDGARPMGDLVEGTDGALYGTTVSGGAYLRGLIFKVNKDGTNFGKVHDFKDMDPNNGAEPHDGLHEGVDGALYGTTFSGGADGYGMVFKLNKDGSSFLNLHDFTYNDAADGASPQAGVIEGSDGELYGTTPAGGAYRGGIVFKLSEDGSSFVNLHDFSSSDGANPYAAMIEASDGALYGTAYGAGAHGLGIVFRLEGDGTGFLNLHDFDQGDAANGAGPYAALLEGSDGALYGTTVYGGVTGSGILFKLNKDGSGFSKLHDFTFSGGNGAYPYAALIEGSDGALYGTTQAGGNQGGNGLAFRIMKDGSGFLGLHSFGSGSGYYPYAALAEASDGLLYGATYSGGVLGAGTLFKMNKDGTGFLGIHDFSSFNAGGANPKAGLVEGSDGSLYGTTVYGGMYDNGVLFKVNKDGTGFLKLHDFNMSDAADGANPQGTLIEASDAALYGTTVSGGLYGSGIAFKINEDGSGFMNVHDFNRGDAANGASPYAGLFKGSDGALYGTTVYGGPGDGGIVFRLTTTPQVPSLSISDVAVTEGNAGTRTPATFNVTLSAPISQTVTVGYKTVNGTAIALLSTITKGPSTREGDYIGQRGILVFEPDEVSKTVTIAVRGDNTPESNETFFVSLSDPTNATLADSEGVGTILDDDGHLLNVSSR